MKRYLPKTLSCSQAVKAAFYILCRKHPLVHGDRLLLVIYIVSLKVLRLIQQTKASKLLFVSTYISSISMKVFFVPYFFLKIHLNVCNLVSIYLYVGLLKQRNFSTYNYGLLETKGCDLSISLYIWQLHTSPPGNRLRPTVALTLS